MQDMHESMQYIKNWLEPNREIPAELWIKDTLNISRELYGSMIKDNLFFLESQPELFIPKLSMNYVTNSWEMNMNCDNIQSSLNDDNININIYWNEWRNSTQETQLSTNAKNSEKIWLLETDLPPIPKITLSKDSETLDYIQVADDSFIDLTRQIDMYLTDSTSIYSISRMTVSSTKPIKKSIHYSWAIKVDLSQQPIIPIIPARKFPFTLDPFQQHAVNHLENDHSLFISAHTSAGKTVIAEYAIALAASNFMKAIYTSPIKALSNQKFRDFSDVFGKSQVGIMTGDVQINTDDSLCLIMTTEILRSILYKSSKIIQDVQVVIFDEVHYINDMERGVVWEEALMMLPYHIKVVMLSATTPNTMEFADWVGRIRQQNIYVIHTTHRPIPLEHHLLGYNEPNKLDLFQIVSSDLNFRVLDCQNAIKSLIGKTKTAHSHDVIHMLHPLINQVLKPKSLLPAVFFIFSRRKCEEYSRYLYQVDLTNNEEKNAIHIFLRESLQRLPEIDRSLPQILYTSESLKRGIAVHHSGILPIMKEAIEILFGMGLVKILFATETFAMGINMPARTTVFTSLRKHDGTKFRYLLAGEYTQMSGRAGRRGKDIKGTVIILLSPSDIIKSAAVIDEYTLREIILGIPTRLTSQFKLTYHMILQLLHMELFQVQDIIKRSFGEHSEQRVSIERQKLLEKEQESYKKLVPLTRFEDCSCSLYISNIYHCIHKKYNLLSILVAENMKLKGKELYHILEKGRIVLERETNNPILILSFSINHKVITIHGILFDLCFNSILPPGKECWNRVTNEILSIDNQESYISENCHVVTLEGMDRIGSITRIKLTHIPLDIHHDLLIESSLLHSMVFEILNSFDSSTLSINDDSLILTPLESLSKKSLELEMAIREWKEIQTELDSLYSLCDCSDLGSHYKLYSQERKINMNIAELQLQLSDENLSLLPEYKLRIATLRKLGYIDEGNVVLLKGRVACEIRITDEILLSELIFHNGFKDFEPEEIVSLLSCFIFQEKVEYEEELSSKLSFGVNMIYDMAKKLGDIQLQVARENNMVPYNLDLIAHASLDKLKCGLVQVVYEWANGMPFCQITNLTDVSEGTIVRTIMRLDEACRDVRNAANLMGNMELLRKIEKASQMIKRDVCFASSLYVC